MRVSIDKLIVASESPATSQSGTDRISPNKYFSALDVESVSKGSLLIVEDDQDQLNAVTRLFILAGYHVTGVTHPRLALGAIAARRFDATLLDTSLPDMDGLELMQRLQNIQEGLPVVILSGYKYPESHAKSLGAFACLVKLCHFELIEATVRQAMDTIAAKH